jgi:hypothetical protein
VSIAVPANAITTGQLPVLARSAPEPTGGRHTFDNPNAVSVVQLGVTRCMRGPHAHTAAKVGNRGWRVSTS